MYCRQTLETIIVKGRYIIYVGSALPRVGQAYNTFIYNLRALNGSIFYTRITACFTEREKERSVMYVWKLYDRTNYNTIPYSIPYDAELLPYEFGCMPYYMNVNYHINLY